MKNRKSHMILPKRGGGMRFYYFFFSFSERAQLGWSVRSYAGACAAQPEEAQCDFMFFFSFSERAQLGWSVRSYAGACACASKQKNIKAHPPPPAPLFGSTLC